MADNYLEKQYAQYAVKKAIWEKTRKLEFIKKRTAFSSQQILELSTKPNPSKEEEKKQ